MFEKSAIGIIIAETPIHCGTGQDIGIVDQPIQRERYTNYPIIQGSEIKGVFRQYYEENSKEEIFGPEESKEEGGDFASAVSFGDARILLFPIKSLKSTYVWITSIDVLSRFQRILKISSINIDIPIPKKESNDNEIIIFDNSIKLEENNNVVIEEYLFKAKNAENNLKIQDFANQIIPNSDDEYKYLKESLTKKMCIVSNDIFKEFIEMSTEIITRIKIDDETGVVAKGALWTEEYLPTDTILYFPIFVTSSRKPKSDLKAENIIEKIQNMNKYMQIGGNETVGKGFVRINWINKK